MDDEDGSLEMLSAPMEKGASAKRCKLVHEEGLVDDASHLIRLENLKISYWADVKQGGPAVFLDEKYEKRDTILERQ